LKPDFPDVAGAAGTFHAQKLAGAAAAARLRIGAVGQRRDSGEGDFVFEKPGLLAIGQLHDNADALAIYGAETGHSADGVSLEGFNHLGGNAVPNPGDPHLGANIHGVRGGSLGHGWRNWKVAQH
jgi:hypothetical protein